MLGRPLHELAHAELHAGGDNKIFGLFLLQHQPLHPHIIFGVPPVAQCVHIAQIQAVFQALRDIGQAARNLAGNERFAAARAFVVEQNAVAGVNAVGFAVIDGNPVGIEFGHGIGRTRIKRRGFFLRDFLHQTVQFGRGGLVKTGFVFQAQKADGFQQAQRADGIDICRVFGGFEAHGNMGLCTQVIYFVGTDFRQQAREVGGIGQIAVVQFEAHVVDVRILVDMVDALGVELRRAAFDAVDIIAFSQQKFCQIRTVLACNAGDKGDFARVGLGHTLSCQ